MKRSLFVYLVPLVLFVQSLSFLPASSCLSIRPFLSRASFTLFVAGLSIRLFVAGLSIRLFVAGFSIRPFCRGFFHSTFLSRASFTSHVVALRADIRSWFFSVAFVCLFALAWLGYGKKVFERHARAPRLEGGGFCGARVFSEGARGSFQRREEAFPPNRIPFDVLVRFGEFREVSSRKISTHGWW